MTIAPAKVLHAAQNGIPLVIQTATLPPETENDLDEILGIFLKELGQERLKDHLSYCLRELTGNAKKANTKRCYFQDKGWDIHDAADYQRGMAAFKVDTLSEIRRYLDLQAEAGLHIRITFLIRNAVLFLQVTNNTPLLPAEQNRIRDRVERARTYESMDQAFEEILDDSEGAGLGIVIMVLMLRKMGLPERAFSIEATETDTVAALRVPMEALRFDQASVLADELVEVVETLPPFPENLNRLMRLLDQPEVQFEDLAAQLSIDPALTSDLIRYINSAGKGRRTRVTNLRDAVQLVGLQGIRDMIVPYGTQKLLDQFVSRQRVLWSDAQRTSELATALAHELRFGRQDRDLAQIAGLFSNLGQIIVSYLHPDLGGQIRSFCQEKAISVTRFNDLTQTINPTELAARVAEKWKFPENLITVLRHQSWPQGVGPELGQVACVVHLAGNLNALEKGLVTVDQFNPEVLKTLEIGSPDQLETLRNRLPRP